MSPRAIIAVAALLLLAVAAVYLFAPRPTRPPASPAKVTAPAPATGPAATPPEPTPPAAAPASTATRKRPVPRPEAAPPVAAATPTLGTLHIDSDVPGAQVFIDRVYVGAAPVTAADITPGTHRLNVSASGYDGYADTIEVTAGARDLMIRLKEVRLDARLEVVHKHRFGSCKGTLIATPKGLRYETGDAGDAFTTPLNALATFEVNYLEKNLRVKLESGKQYSFAEPAGNADRLFVFHRDVDAARKKLAAAQ